MKKIQLTLLALFSLYLNVNSQISISCYFRDICYWNAYNQKFENCNGYVQRSLFEVNKTETMIVHTTDKLTSTYYVKYASYEEEYKIWSYDVISDVGNKYTFMFDFKNNLVKVLDNGRLSMYYIKSAF